jgi:Dolichyl-phosphate-mannose-protein mannosyltransferase
LRNLNPSGALYPLCAFVAAATLNVVSAGFFSASGNENSDFSGFYEPVARSILSGSGYPISGATSLSYPPGFPLAIAAAYAFADAARIPEHLALAAMNALCVGASAVLVFLIARELWDGQSAVGGALAWSTYPLNLWLAKQPNSEVVFLLPYYGAVYLVLRDCGSHGKRVGCYFLSGLLAGAAMLVRPIAIGLGVTLAVTAWVVTRKTRTAVIPALALLAGTLVAVLPWEAWVYRKTGRVILLSTNGPPSIADGLTYTGYRPYRVVQSSMPFDDVAGLMGRLEAAIRSDTDSLKSMTSLARQVGPVLAADPGSTVKLLMLKVIRAWYATDSGRREAAVLAIQLVYLPLLAWSFATCWRLGARQRGLLVVLLVQVLYFWSMTVLGLSIVRYLTPTIGLLFVLVPALVKRSGPIENP